MCLKIKSFAKAEHDITCYKILYSAKGANGYLRFYTPFEEKLVSPKCISGDKLFEAEYPSYWGVETRINTIKDLESMLQYTGSTEISVGFIHSYKNLSDLEDRKNVGFYRWMRSVPLGGECRVIHIFECVIPKGTLYCEGYINDSDTVLGYAAKKVIFKKELELPESIREEYCC